MSVVAAKGFKAVGVSAGIKSGGRDLAVVISERPSAYAGVFTMNQAAAPPVLVSRERLLSADAVRGIVLNSGCANAATGEEGIVNARAMTSRLAAEIGADASQVLVCSTGTIGPQLPMERVLEGIDVAAASAATSAEAGTSAADAIRTTDSVTKEATVVGEGWTVGGMSKGSGMIRPDMATMLAVVTTDAVVESAALSAAFSDAAATTFNSLNIDGCESTNDTAIALASGESGVKPEPEVFARAIFEVCQDLALQMARDAEGASRVVTIDIAGAVSDTDARTLGRLVSDSALVRASFYGGDVNWGRIVGALGTSTLCPPLHKITISYEDTTVFVDGMGAQFDEEKILAAIAHGDFSIGIDLGVGEGEARIVTTDLTPEYVRFNGERS